MNALEQAVAILKDGGIIAYPTETVFGLGCDPQNELAVKKLLEIKQRPIEKGLILIAASSLQLECYIDLATLNEYPDVVSSWPGPNTWLLPCKNTTPYWLHGQYDTLAVRVIDHEIATPLCELFGGPIVSTSANISDHPPARSTAEVYAQFHQRLDFVLEGTATNPDTVSTIRDAKTGKQLR